MEKEHNYRLYAYLVPEWSKSLARITSAYAGTQTDGTVETEDTDFNEYYAEHPDKHKPLYMWGAPLVIKFEYVCFDESIMSAPNSGMKDATVTKLNYNEALDNYIKYAKKRDKLLNMITDKKVIVDYVLVKKQKDRTKAKKHPYWIYPKVYSGEFSKENMQKLKDNRAFLIKSNEYEGFPQQVAAVLNIRAATVEDISKYKQMDIKFWFDGFTKLGKEQLIALGNYKYLVRKAKK